MDSSGRKSTNLVFLIASVNTGSRSGKNTVAEAMISHAVSVSDWIRPTMIEFSYPLKWICEEVLGLDKEYVIGSKKQEPTGISIKGIADNATCRQIQQYIGTEVFRDMFGENIWVKRADRLIKKHNEDGNFIGPGHSNFSFLPDWRFENECSYLQEQGHKVITINVDRPSNQTGITGHRSDNSLAKYADSMDYYLVNDGSKRDIQIKACDVMQEILEKHSLYSVGRCC